MGKPKEVPRFENEKEKVDMAGSDFLGTFFHNHTYIL